MRKLSMKYKIIPALLCLVILAGCQTSQSVTLPTKPTLAVMVQTDGGMCLNAEDTGRLAVYIIELERVITQTQ